MRLSLPLTAAFEKFNAMVMHSRPDVQQHETRQEMFCVHPEYQIQPKYVYNFRRLNIQTAKHDLAKCFHS